MKCTEWQTTICCSVLFAESIKHLKLFRTRKNKKLELNQQIFINKSSCNDTSTLQAWYLVALTVARKSKPHTIAENLRLIKSYQVIVKVISRI